MADTVEERARAVFEAGLYGLTWEDALRLPPFRPWLEECRQEARAALLREARAASPET